MFQDLEGSDVAVCRNAMLQLGIVLSVKGITDAIDNPSEETFPDEPCSGNEVPILLLEFRVVLGHCVVDGWLYNTDSLGIV